MILNLIMKLFSWVSDLLMGFTRLPIFPSQVGDTVAFVLEWMSAGMGIIDFFCPMEAVAPAVAFFLVVFSVQKIYHLVMWVITKIPMLGVSK